MPISTATKRSARSSSPVPSHDSLEGGSQADLRNANQRRVIELLTNQGQLTQATIARQSGLAASTVSNIVHQLIKQGVIKKIASRGGPHGQKLSLVPPRGYVAGVEVGQKHLTITLANLAHQILVEWRGTLTVPNHWQQVLPLLHKQLDRLAKDNQLHNQKLLALGLALPAPISVNQHQVGSTQVLPGWSEINITQKIEAEFQVPVIIDNDANLGAIGERTWGCAQGIDNLVYLKISHGLGAGIILNGQLYRGADGTAGELGHVIVLEHGPLCRCGNRGCLETLASEAAVLDSIRPLFGPDYTIADLVQDANLGNQASLRILADTGGLIGQALANLTNTLNPRLIIIGGSLAQAGDLLMAPIISTLNRRAVSSQEAHLQVKLSTLKEYAHARGAVSMALKLANSTK